MRLGVALGQRSVDGYTRGRVALAALAALCLLAIVIVGVETPRFLTVDNAKAILNSASLVGIIALGMTFITIVGSMVSLASGATAVAAAMVFMYELRLGLVPALALAILTGAVVTGIQGLIVGAWGANAVILTIGASFLISGVAQKMTSDVIVHASGGGYKALNATPAGVPVGVYVMLLVAVVFQYVLKRTVLGRQIVLVGENQQAARAAGLRITWVTVAAFAIAGTAFALGGAFLGAFNQGASLQLEGTSTFDAIAAVLVGGTVISGGRGSALRTLVGAIVIATISDVLLLNGLGTGPQILLKGLLVVAVVLALHITSGRRGP